MYQNIFSLKDRHIIITGATGLVGTALAMGLSAFGARLTLVARDVGKLTSLYESFPMPVPSGSSTYALDLNSKEEVMKFLSLFSPDKNPVHGVVHCAMARPAQKSLCNYEELFEASLTNNALSSFLIWEGFSKLMEKSNGGSLVYIGSIFGNVSPDFSVYEGTKMGTEPDYMFIKEGMNGLSKYYANKFGHAGVRSNLIILGGVKNNQPTSFVEKFVQKIPLQRMAIPSDVVGACIYLLSDASKYVTGSQITVDGGYLSR